MADVLEMVKDSMNDYEINPDELQEQELIDLVEQAKHAIIDEVCWQSDAIAAFEITEEFQSLLKRKGKK